MPRRRKNTISQQEVAERVERDMREGILVDEEGDGTDPEAQSKNNTPQRDETEAHPQPAPAGGALDTR